MLEIQKMVHNWIEDRPTMKANNQDKSRMMELLRLEVEELAEVIHDPEEVKGELIDVIFFAMTIADMMGIDVDAEFRDKHAFNLCRYAAGYFQDGDYDEARKRVKREEKEFVKRDFYSIERTNPPISEKVEV